MLFLYSVDRLIQLLFTENIFTLIMRSVRIFSAVVLWSKQRWTIKKASHNSVVRLANHTGRGLLTHRKTRHGRSETLSQLSFDNLLKFSIKLKECLCPHLTVAAATSKTNWIRGFLCLKKRHSRIVEFIAQGSSQGFWNHNIIYILLLILDALSVGCNQCTRAKIRSL